MSAGSDRVKGVVRLTIDGKAVETAEGRTILEAAREHGISIPALCYHANLLSIGSCRICVVEVEGYANPMASCATVAQEGMVVTTRSPRLVAMRRDYLKLILAYHPLDCPVCDAGGECDLQDLVFEHGIEKADLSVTRAEKVEAYATPLIKYFENRCVLCLRCIHACREVSGRHVLDLVETGIDARMAPTNARNCISCGECLFVCPVGALTENLSPVKARRWQVTRHFTTCPHCGFGCAFELDVYNGTYVTDVIQDVKHEPNHGSLCVMGRFGCDFVNHEARIRQATVKGAPASVEEAASAAVDGLRGVVGKDKRVAFVVSPRATNEELFLLREIAGRLGKASLATSAYYHTGRVMEAYGRAGLSYPYRYERLLEADLIVVAGANLLSNNHLLADRVRDAVKLKGARIVVIDPAPTALTPIADAHLSVRPGTDAALFRALEARMAGQAHDGALMESGVDEAAFERLCGLLARSANTAVIFGSGLSASDESLEALLAFCVRMGLGEKGLIMPVARAANAVGAASIAPGAAPDELLSQADVGGIVFYEEDPFHYMAAATASGLIGGKEFVLVADALPTTVMEHAHIVVPTGVFTEKEGTFFAGDGAIRRLSMATGDCAAYPGFAFLSRVLSGLGGPEFAAAHEVTALMREKGMIRTVEGREEAGPPEKGAAAGSAGAYAGPGRPEDGGFILVTRDIFSNHHLADKEIYSRGVATVYRHPGYPVSEDKLFMSPEDARVLRLAAGDVVEVVSGEASLTKPLSLKEGLRPGVIEHIVFRDRAEVLGLAKRPVKWIGVKVRKG